MISNENAVQTVRYESGAIKRFDLMAVDAIAREIRRAVMRDGIELRDILQLAAINAAKRLGIENGKGSLEAGKHADIVILNRDLEIETVLAKGKVVLRDKELIVA